MQTTLYYRQGSSDKVYSLNIATKSDGYTVDFRYGRRGNALTDGTKTAKPVSLEQAQKIFNKLVAEKIAKGYSPGQDGRAYQDTQLETHDSGLRPMLLNAIDESQAQALVANNDWGMQEKLDGKRVMLKRHSAKEEYALGRTVSGSNRRGIEIALPIALVDLVSQLEPCILDGEMIGEQFHAFDLLERSGYDITSFGYAQRHTWLVELLEPVAGLHIAALYEQGLAKALVLDALKTQNAEGVVFKNLSAPYTAGRPSSGGHALKFKFTQSASVIVTRLNAQRSVCVGLADGTKLGNVTIPPNSQIPDVGQVIEVRYLYCYPQGSLYQPVYLGARTDVATDECVIGQLKFKPEGEEES